MKERAEFHVIEFLADSGLMRKFTSTVPDGRNCLYGPSPKCDLAVVKAWQDKSNTQIQPSGFAAPR